MCALRLVIETAVDLVKEGGNVQDSNKCLIVLSAYSRIIAFLPAATKQANETQVNI